MEEVEDGAVEFGPEIGTGQGVVTEEHLQDGIAGFDVGERVGREDGITRKEGGPAEGEGACEDGQGVLEEAFAGSWSLHAGFIPCWSGSGRASDLPLFSTL